VFQKKNNLYGLNVTKSEVGRESSIILVEGYMDAVSLYQSGVRNVAASLGTALTENQARLIKRYTDNVILSYDADAAGQNAAYRGLDILHKQGLKAKVLKVSDGKDPDEFIKKKGKKAFMELVDNAASYGDFKINYVMSKYNMEDEEQRIDFMDEAINMLHSMKPVEADIYASKLAEVSGISERNIKEQYYEGGGREQVPHRQSRSFDSENTWEEAKTSGRSRTTDGSTEAELMLLKLMIIDEKYMDIPEDIRDLVFTNDDTNSIYDALCQLGDTQRPIDMNQFIERLDQASIDCLARIEDKIIPGGKEEEIFSDCIWKIKQGELRRQEKDIEDMISIAEEEGNHQQLEELMEKLMTIQRKMKGI
jgi:DNA primase